MSRARSVSDETTSSERWWVGLQAGYGIGGGAVWLGGKVLENEFVAGAGLGLVVAALVLRFGREAAAND